MQPALQREADSLWHSVEGRVYLGQEAIKDRELARKPLDLHGLPIRSLLFPSICPQKYDVTRDSENISKNKSPPSCLRKSQRFWKYPCKVKGI